jgi:hypothetical protein
MRSRSSKHAALLHALLTVVLASTITGTGALAQSKGQGVEVRAVGPKIVEGKPGRILSTSFMITNSTDREIEFVESLALPAGWQAISPPATLILDPGQSKPRIIAFVSAPSTPAGRHEVAYSVKDPTDFAVQDSEAVAVEILPVTQLEILVEEKPETAIAGDEYRVRLRIVNQCNFAVDLAIDARSTEGYSVRCDPYEMSLEAGGSRVVTAAVRTNEGVRKSVTDCLLIGARAKNSNVTDGISVPMTIVPKMAAELDAYHRLPVRLEMKNISEGQNSGTQVEFSGSGTLDDLGSSAIDFLFRTSGTERTGIYAQPDEYRLDYTSLDCAMLIGDRTYGLSQLTDYYRYGRGAGLRIGSEDSWSLGAFALKSRWSTPENEERGIYVARSIDENVRMKANFLERNILAPSRISDRMQSIEASAKLLGSMNLASEFAACSSNRSGGSDGEAYRLSADGRIDEIYYSIGKIHADPDYFGYYRDCDYANASVLFPICKTVRAELSGQTWKENLLQDESKSDAPQESFSRIGLQYDLDSKTSISLSRDTFHRKDMLPSPKFDYREESLRLGIGRSSERFSLQAYVDYGRQKDILSGRTRRAEKYSLYWLLRPSTSECFTLYAQLGDDSIDEPRLLGGSNTLGISASRQYRDNLRLSANYVLNGFDSDRQRVSHQLYVDATYGPKDGRHWSLNMRSFDKPGSSSQTEYMLSYITPWEMPVSRRKRIGTIAGRVFDLESPGSSGMPRVIVTVGGMSRATDDNGEFEFPYLSPGNYSVSVEQGTIGLGRVTGKKLPIMMEVKAGEVARIDVPVTRSADLFGKIAVYSYAAAAEPTDIGAARLTAVASENMVLEGSGSRTPSARPSSDDVAAEVAGAAGILIELASGDETIRKLTDGSGRFSMEGLRPGFWHLKVYENNLPDYHYLETKESDIVLQPGEQHDLVLKVLPHLRPVKIIEHAILIGKAAD